MSDEYGFEEDTNMATNSNDSDNQEDREASNKGVDMDVDDALLKGQRRSCFRQRMLQRFIGWQPTICTEGDDDG